VMNSSLRNVRLDDGVKHRAPKREKTKDRRMTRESVGNPANPDSHSRKIFSVT